MSTRNQVLRLLRGSPADRIRFSFPFSAGTVVITPASFRRVAQAIESGKVQLNVTKAFPPGVAGTYQSGTPNTLSVAPLLGRVEEGLLLHECTHAVFDLTKTLLTDNEDEAAAYVVDALFFRMTSLKHPRWNAEPHASAGPVADALLLEYQKGGVPVPAVDGKLFAALRMAVMFHPVYFGGNSGPLGVLLGRQTGHDG